MMQEYEQHLSSLGVNTGTKEEQGWPSTTTCYPRGILLTYAGTSVYGAKALFPHPQGSRRGGRSGHRGHGHGGNTSIKKQQQPPQ